MIKTTESWITFKVVYALKDYGPQYIVADHFHINALAFLEKAVIQLASSRIQVELSK